jgi:toxin CcdB
MAQFDVFRLADGGLVLDCQSSELDEIGTRFVVPLIPPAESAPHNAYLNPSFEVDDEQVSMVTQFAMAIRTRELRRRVGSLASHRDQIVCAIERLIGAG